MISKNIPRAKFLICPNCEKQVEIAKLKAERSFRNLLSKVQEAPCPYCGSPISFLK